jgi:dTDP-4-dehydrorhamnose reductase
VSTDAVFDGRNGPYGPEAPLSPVNVYGRSKQDGELAVLEKDSEALVVRTNIVGWSRTGTRSLLEYFYRGLARGEPVPGYIDIFFRPLPVHWFWPGCESFMAAGATGVVHLTGPELLSKYEFGRRVANAFGLNEELVVPVEGLTDDVKAPRPPCLDVVPSRLSGKLPVPDDLDKGLQELWRMRCGERLGE